MGHRPGGSAASDYVHGYEYILRATDSDGSVVSESKPRRRTSPFSWAAGLGAAVLRGRHPDIVVRQLRRPVGSDQPWTEVPR